MSVSFTCIYNTNKDLFLNIAQRFYCLNITEFLMKMEVYCENKSLFVGKRTRNEEQLWVGCHTRMFLDPALSLLRFPFLWKHLRLVPTCLLRQEGAAAAATNSVLILHSFYLPPNSLALSPGHFK